MGRYCARRRAGSVVPDNTVPPEPPVDIIVSVEAVLDDPYVGYVIETNAAGTIHVAVYGDVVDPGNLAWETDVVADDATVIVGTSGAGAYPGHTWILVAQVAGCPAHQDELVR